MSNVQNRAPGVDNVLLNIFFMDTIPAHCDSITPSNFSLSPPAVRCMRWVSALSGLIASIMRQYVTSFPLGNLPLGMKKMLLFPFGMHIATPWDSPPRSL